MQGGLKGHTRQKTFLRKFSGDETQWIVGNIHLKGDFLRKRWEGDGFMCHRFQNIFVMDRKGGIEVNTEREVMNEVGIGTQGYVESDVPWTEGRKAEYDFMLGILLDYPKTIYLSSTTHHEQEYLPWGQIALPK